jgi:hypothetical protein
VRSWKSAGAWEAPRQGADELHLFVFFVRGAKNMGDERQAAVVTGKAEGFIRTYLSSARAGRVHEASVLAGGERMGISERRLRRAARKLEVVVDTETSMWSLPPVSRSINFGSIAPKLDPIGAAAGMPTRLA